MLVQTLFSNYVILCSKLAFAHHFSLATARIRGLDVHAEASPTPPRGTTLIIPDLMTRYNALPQEERERLDRVMVRRRLNAGDVGWLAPLVRTCPVTGLRGLHSPFWASRPGVRPPVEVDGMSESESRAFLDRLEAHVLKPEFRRV